MAKLFAHGEEVRLIVQVHNQGQTPALAINVSGQSETFDVRGFIPLPGFDRDAEGLDWGAVGPNETLQVPVEHPHLTHDYSAVFDGNGFITLRINGLVRYRTMFDELYETEFSFHTKSRHSMVKVGPAGAIEDDPIILSRAPYPLPRLPPDRRPR